MLYQIRNNKGLIGLQDEKGRIVVSPQFKSLTDFNNEGIAVFSMDDMVTFRRDCFSDYPVTKWGAINDQGNIVVKPFICSKLDNFRKGYAIFTYKDGEFIDFVETYVDRYGIVDSNGNLCKKGYRQMHSAQIKVEELIKSSEVLKDNGMER